jgi:hypothetical protein
MSKKIFRAFDHVKCSTRVSNPAAIWLCLLVCISCGDRETETLDQSPAEKQQAYFPLNIGRYTEYQVDSVVYDFQSGGSTKRDSNTVFVREIMTDTLRDQTGQLLYKIERYERQLASQPWVLTHIGTAGRTSKQAFKTELNLRYLKMIFPMDRRSEWDGNVWIDKDREIEIAGERMRPFSNWFYEVDSIDIRRTVGKFAFDSTLVITEADDNNVIERRFSRVRYAKNVGLVERTQLILDSQYCNKIPPPSDCTTRPWEIKGERGYILKQRIIAWGK